MKNLKKSLAVIGISVMVFAACGPKSEIEGFKRTKTGLHYKFEQENKGAQAVQNGDVLVCEMVMTLNDSVLFDNTNNPQRLLMAGESIFPGDLNEGLMMMHLGDVATFAVEADSMAARSSMPPYYKQGAGMKVFHKIKLISVVTKAEFDKEKAEFEAEMAKLRDEEPEAIRKYIEDNNIKVQPAENGLYIIEKKKGKGAKVQTGKKVKVNYSGRLLNGKLFDTSKKDVAISEGVYDAQRPYEPLSYIVGQMSLIPGWEQAMSTLSEGSVATIIMPSELGYGARANVGIPPYSPLVFDLEVLSVE